MAKKVIVAMSGGVDSSAAALLLKREGYDVTGITMQIWPQAEDNTRACCSFDAVHDARRVAWHLDIPHYVMNFRREFESRVIGYFCQEYVQGRTPNPCIACNQYIKFESLLQKSLALGADYIATGHYARIVWNENMSEYQVLRGKDENKDQSYALYSLTQQQLQHILFPLGEYRKDEIRKIAREAGLPVADKQESQEICFVSDNDYAGFVDRYLNIPVRKGRIMSQAGECLGSHHGVHHFTIGQRKGLGLALGHPVYVTRINAGEQTVWVGENQDLYSHSLIADHVHYISQRPLPPRGEISAKIRYGSSPAAAYLTPLGGKKIRIDFKEKQRAITPGQAVVFYQGHYLLGGAIIQSAGENE